MPKRPNQRLAPPQPKRRITLDAHGGSASVLAEVGHGLALHAAYNEPGWTITCVGLGLRVATLKTEAEARKLLAQLVRHTQASAWEGKTVEACLAALPLWVVPWVRECREAGRCLPLEEYLELAREIEEQEEGVSK